MITNIRTEDINLYMIINIMMGLIVDVFNISHIIAYYVWPTSHCHTATRCLLAARAAVCLGASVMDADVDAAAELLGESLTSQRIFLLSCAMAAFVMAASVEAFVCPCR